MPNPNSKTLSPNFDLIEKAFDQNLSGFDFKKMKNDSVISMRKLLKENVHFDFIYIDGSHNGEDILSDAIEAFKILKVNGLMFFDDFLQHDDNRILQSYVGIDKFLSLYSDYLEIEYFQNNLVVRKKWNISGEVAEWLKAHAWKACKGVTLSWVRIPFSPPQIIFVLCGQFDFFFKLVKL